MLLTIDAGNTNTVFAVFENGALKQCWRCRSAGTKTADEYLSFLHPLFIASNISAENFTDVIISSVVPESNHHLQRFCKGFLKREPIVVNRNMIDIEVDLHLPDEVGSDRLVNALAIKTYYKAPAIVLDFGTATTFDVIDENMVYRGGVIAPGVNLSISALAQAASKLPKIEVIKPSKAIGRSTVSAMQSGVYWGYIGLIEGIISKLTAELNEKPMIVATGGLSSVFENDLPVLDAIDQNLNIRGLLEVHKTLQEKSV